MKKLMKLLEVQKGAVELKKGTSDSDIKKYTDKGIDVQLVDPSTEKLEEVAGRKYTAEESGAVGKTVGKSLLKVLRDQGDEVVDIRLTGVGLNKFNIRVKYGNDKGHDVFKFTLNPDTEDITLDLGTGEGEQLVDFIITQGNTVSLPTPELESRLADAMKKYTSEPSDAQYDQMAAMEPETDPSQMGKYIPEGDINDPVAVKLRAAKIATPTQAPAKTYSAKLNALQAERTRILADMEQEAELEGGPVADKYGAMLTRIDNAIAKIKSNSTQIDETVAENTTTFKVGDKVTYLGAPGEITAAEDRYGNQYVSVAYNKGQGRTKVSGVLATNGDVQHAKPLQEKQLTKPEVKKREDIVKAMKKQGEPKDARTYAIATAQAKKVAEAAKPDYIDIDKDGNRKESMKKAVQDKKLAEDLDIGHQDNEPEMLKADLYKIAKYAISLYKMMDELKHEGEVDFPHWWQAKVIKASSYLASAKHYLEFERNQPAADAVVATLGEAKGTCCHKCGHVHVKGTSHPTPYKTGQKNCKFRD